MNKLQKLIKEEIHKALNEVDYFDSDEFSNADNPEQREPQDDDCFIEDLPMKGYGVSCGGKFVGEFPDMEKSLKAVSDWQKTNNWSPDIWFVSDHGNINLIDQKGNFVEGVIKEDIYSQISAGLLAMSLILTFLPPAVKFTLKAIDMGGVKNLYNNWKRDKTITPILDRLSKDPEVVNHLKTKGTKGIRNIINSKLMDNEKKYVNQVYGKDIQDVIKKSGGQ